MFEFIEIMRQREDLKLAEALNRMPTGTLTKDDLSMFRHRCYGSFCNFPAEI